LKIPKKVAGVNTLDGSIVLAFCRK